MKKFLSVTVLLFLLGLFKCIAVYADGIGVKDSKNLPVFKNDTSSQIYNVNNVYIDIPMRYYRESDEFDNVLSISKGYLLQDVDFNSFISDFNDAIRKNWTPIDCGDMCKVYLLITVDKFGKLLSNEIFCSSGNEIFDKSVIDTVQKSAPFSALPEKYMYNSIPVLFSFEQIRSKDAFFKNDDQFLLKAYLPKLEKSIKKNWHPPRTSRLSYRVVLFFKLDKQGKVKFCKVLMSSKNESLDKAVIDAVKLAEPFFGPLPEEYKGEKIDIIFTFNYNVKGSGLKGNMFNKGLNCSLTNESPSKHIFYNLKDKEQKKIFNEYIDYITYVLNSIENPDTMDSVLKVRFSINKTGNVQNIKIVASNYNKKFNDTVLSKLENIRFSSLPEKLGISELTVEYQIDNIKKGNNYLPALGATAGLTGLFMLIFGSL